MLSFAATFQEFFGSVDRKTISLCILENEKLTKEWNVVVFFSFYLRSARKLQEVSFDHWSYNVIFFLADPSRWNHWSCLCNVCIIRRIHGNNEVRFEVRTSTFSAWQIEHLNNETNKSGKIPLTLLAA